MMIVLCETVCMVIIVTSCMIIASVLCGDNCDCATRSLLGVREHNSNEGNHYWASGM